MSLILNGQKIATPGLETISWLDDPKVPQATDGNPRSLWIRAIVLHTVSGILGPLKPGMKPSNRAETYAQYQAKTTRDVSWDYTMDTDGTIIVSNDPIQRYTWHAGAVNPWTIGIEMVQDSDGSLYEGQMEVTVKFLDKLTKELADLPVPHPIQRQVPMTADGKPVRGVIHRIQDQSLARNVVGVYGHRNQTKDRGPGDPGDHIFNYLMQAGYKGFNLDAGDDITFWKSMQTRLGLKTVDGIPGREMQKALRAAGDSHGLHVSRPGD